MCALLTLSTVSGGSGFFSGWGAGWGVKTFVALAHMVDATQHMGWGDNISCTYATYGVGGRVGV